MSHYTTIQVHVFGEFEWEYLSGELLDKAVKLVVANEKDWAHEAGWIFDGPSHQSEREELADALVGGFVSIHGYVNKIDALFERLSSLERDVIIGVRGFEEEFEDIWVRYYKRGKVYDFLPEDTAAFDEQERVLCGSDVEIIGPTPISMDPNRIAQTRSNMIGAYDVRRDRMEVTY